jgi:hypothetical protein
MFLKTFPDAFRRIVTAPCSDVAPCSDMAPCGNVVLCSDVAPCSDVEERRFSAASCAFSDVGFSPRGGSLRVSRSFPQPLRNVLTVTLSGVAILLLSFVSPFAAQAQKPAQAGVTADLPPGTMQAKATTACLECHEARIILQQRLSKPAWTKEVDKMMKWGAIVEAADRDALIDYLSMNFSPDKPPYEPQRTAGKSGKTSK